jgi:serine/threonine-protein kinase
MVLLCFAVAVIGHWEHVSSDSAIEPQISWIGVILLIFAAIVPTAPWKLLIASIIAVSMNPASMLVARARGIWHFEPATMVFVMHFPDYLLIGVALVISRVVATLGRQVRKAREMGSYRLVKLLGKGGMGEVWQANHRMLSRDSAIKLIQPDLLNRLSPKQATQIERRFEQEAKTTASLRSPHTVELYDFGVTEEGVLYYVMELLDGIDLATLVKTFGPQPPARVVHILLQVCRSLAEAHRHGMVHRDIKPNNIYLCRMGNEYDFVKVLDFGLVKVLDTNDPHITQTGAVTGTPAYMAPEMALGEDTVDGRCDLYGLGCVAYWLLTGQLVFEEKTLSAMMLAHLQKSPVPPSKRSGSNVSAALEHAILLCLAKKPDDRPASADVLARLLTESPEAEWTQDNAELWWKTNAPEEGRDRVHQEDPTITASLIVPQKRQGE